MLLDGPDIPLVGKFKVEGQAWFDAILHFNPLAFELTLAGISGTGTVTTTDPRPGVTEPIARDANLDGFVVYPTFGFIGEF